jgi:hypothetical protein
MMEAFRMTGSIEFESGGERTTAVSHWIMPKDE